LIKQWLYACLVVCLMAGSACDSSDPDPQGPGDAHELRIANAGDEDIQRLIVLFPDTDPSATARIEFGEVASGETTEYVAVPGGVYRYAAYEYTLDGQTVHQPVMDWVGEVPLEASRFTYQISLDTARVRGDQMRLIDVVEEAE
jgi:hypothetical protein